MHFWAYNQKMDDRKQTIKAPQYYKTAQNSFALYMSKVLKRCADQYQRQAIEALHAKTINKFKDAQGGNYAVVFQKLAKQVTKKIKNNYNFKTLRRQTDIHLNKQNKLNKEQFYKRVSGATGIDTKQLLKSDIKQPEMNALSIETANWFEKQIDDTLANWTANTITAMSRGDTVDDIISTFTSIESKGRKHAKFVAKQQMSMYNSILTKKRSVNLGIKKAVWVTTEDEKARPSHKERDGKPFNLDVGLKGSDGLTLIPRQDYRCRCTFELIIPDDL